MTKKKLLIGALIIFTIGTFISLNNPGTARGEETFALLDGTTKSISEITAMPKVILFFWTTWCPYCSVEMKRINNNFFYPPDIQMILVNLTETQKEVENFATRIKLSENMRKKIILDKKGVLADKFFITGMPTFIFLKNGETVYRSYSVDEQMIQEVFNEASPKSSPQGVD